MRVFLLLAVTLLCVSCTARLQSRAPRGETAKVTFLNEEGKKQAAIVELLSVNDSLLFFRNDGGYVQMPMDKVTRINITAYNTYKALRFVSILPTLAAGVILYANNKPENLTALPRVLVMLGFGSLVTIVYFTAPHTTYRPPLTQKRLERLQLYCRYPQGLTAEQWRQLRQTPHAAKQ